MEQKRKVLPPVYFLMSLVATAILHYALPITRLVSPPYIYSGVVLIVAGIAIATVASGAFRRAGTPVVPFEPSTALITDGLYRVTRNPMYLGLLLTLAGVAILCGTLGAFLPLPVFFWILRSQFVIPEERFLEGIFGAQYLDYKRRVRRWL